MRQAVLLDTPAPSLAAALAHHGYIQIDPINVCGRMHDLILRNRVHGYAEGDLHRYVHAADRPAYEHYLPGPTSILVAYPITTWPVLAGRIRRRRLRGGAYGRPLAPTYEHLARRILAEIAGRGPLTSDDIEHDRRSRTGWGTPGRLVKNILEHLLIHGRVLISSRRNFRRVYDLPERVLPATMLAAPEAGEEEVTRWLALIAVRQRRLVRLPKKQLPLIDDLVQAVQVRDGPLLHCLRTDLPLLAASAGEPAAGRGKAREPLVLMAPLDPLIYDRRVTSSLWNYDYTWEAYTPPAKRRRGYYALPALAGTELVGHVDAKADRAAGRLRLVSGCLRRGHRLRPAVRALAGWLGLK
jgi:uncharacterized protein YcaQ